MTNKTKNLLTAAAIIVAGLIIAAWGVSHISTDPVGTPDAQVKASDAAAKAAWAGYGQPHQHPASASTSAKPAAVKPAAHGDSVKNLGAFAPWDSATKGDKSHE